MENQKLVYGGVGFLLGLTLNDKYRGIINILYWYLLSVLVMRIYLTYDLKLKLTWIGLFDVCPGYIPIQYNIWYNRVIVKRTLLTKIATNSDQIESELRRGFDICLGWDIFYHYRPLTIKFE
jgi:hypothetical protein